MKVKDLPREMLEQWDTLDLRSRRFFCEAVQDLGNDHPEDFDGAQRDLSDLEMIWNETLDLKNCVERLPPSNIDNKANELARESKDSQVPCCLTHVIRLTQKQMSPFSTSQIVTSGLGRSVSLLSILIAFDTVAAAEFCSQVRRISLQCCG